MTDKELYKSLSPEFDTSNKRKNRKQAQKISILCGFFWAFSIDKHGKLWYNIFDIMIIGVYALERVY